MPGPLPITQKKADAAGVATFMGHKGKCLPEADVYIFEGDYSSSFCMDLGTNFSMSLISGP